MSEIETEIYEYKVRVGEFKSWLERRVSMCGCPGIVKRWHILGDHGDDEHILPLYAYSRGAAVLGEDNEQRFQQIDSHFPVLLVACTYCGETKTFSPWVVRQEIDNGS